MISIAPCPECGSKFEMQVAAGMSGSGTGRRYICGTIYWLEQKRVTVRGTACVRIHELEAENAALKNEAARHRDRLRWLDALETAGVDNWAGCEYAIELRQEWDQKGEQP